MYIASTEKYPGAFEEESIAALVKKAANSRQQFTEVFQYIDDIEVYISASELISINNQVANVRKVITDNIRDTEFYNQETARLIYDRI